MPDYGINSGLPQIPAGQQDKEFNLVLPIYTAINNLSQNISKSTGLVNFSQAELADRNQLGSVISQNLNKIYIRADGAALDYGRLIHITLVGGVLVGEYASAANATKPAQGIVNNPAGIQPGEFGEIVVFNGLVRGIGGSVVGATYWLSTTPGLVSLTAPAAVGTVKQAVGWGLGSGGFLLSISSQYFQN